MKFHLLFVMLCLIPIAMFSQNGFGIEVGSNLSSTSAEDATRLGFHTGIVNRMILSQKLYGQAEICYTQKGFTDGGQFIQSFDYLFVEQRFDYVSTGFSLGYNVLGDFSIQLGAEGAYLIHARTVLYQQVFKGTGGMDKFDFSLIVGLQFQINHLSIYTRYVHGFVDMRDFSLSDINGLTIGKGEVGTLQTFQVGVSLTNILPMTPSLSKDKLPSSRNGSKGRYGKSKTI